MQTLLACYWAVLQEHSTQPYVFATSGYVILEFFQTPPTNYYPHPILFWAGDYSIFIQGKDTNRTQFLIY